MHTHNYKEWKSTNVFGPQGIFSFGLLSRFRKWYSGAAELQINGQYSSWDYQWHYSSFVCHPCAIFPHRENMHFKVFWIINHRSELLYIFLFHRIYSFWKYNSELQILFNIIWCKKNPFVLLNTVLNSMKQQSIYSMHQGKTRTQLNMHY